MSAIDRAYTEPVGALTVTLTEEGRADPLFADLPDVFDAYGGHKEGASSLPSNLACLPEKRISCVPWRVASATLGRCLSKAPS